MTGLVATGLHHKHRKTHLIITPRIQVWTALACVNSHQTPPLASQGTFETVRARGRSAVPLVRCRQSKKKWRQRQHHHHHCRRRRVVAERGGESAVGGGPDEFDLHGTVRYASEVGLVGRKLTRGPGRVLVLCERLTRSRDRTSKA